MMRSRDATDSAARPVVPAPRANPDLLGHAAVEAELRRLFDNGRLPHALLLGGPRGIGKATLAFRLARFVLAQSSGEGSQPPLLADSPDAALAIPPDSGVSARRRQRERIVGNNRPGLCATSTSSVRRGGSSRIFSSAFAALRFISSAPSTITTRQPPSAAVKCRKAPISRVSSTTISLRNRRRRGS